MEIIYFAVGGLVLLILGFFAGKYMQQRVYNKTISEANERANLIIKEAEVKAETTKNNKKMEAKEHFLKLKQEHEEEFQKKKNTIINNENKVKQKEQNAKKLMEDNEKKAKELEKKENELQELIDTYNNRKEELDEYKKKHVEELEKVSNMSAEDAKNELFNNLVNEAHTKAASHIKNIVQEARHNATREAKKVIIETIQRTASEHALENCVSVFNIENDAVKGKIIGREGRNIRALEAATGIEIIVDDTPEAIIISGFDPIRREIARLSLHRLVADGRIHPARIEEVVEKTSREMDEEIQEIGERTIIDLNIHGLHPDLIKYVGRMRFRSSYGQNLLQHSIEVANLAATMSAELGLDTKFAKRAGLLHDIGKVPTEESEQPHAILGMELAKKYNEHDEVCNAIGAHHDEIEMKYLISPIVQSCDAISGSRPGARKEITDTYLKRLEDMENIATSFEGVNKCYAMQAGRELRVIADAENISDEKAELLSYEISQKIEKEMQYPGQIKVTVIREMRSVTYAK